MKFFDCLFLMRPMLIIPVWTISLLGARAAGWRERGLNPFEIDRYPVSAFTTLDLNLLLVLLLGGLLAGGVFILNQIYDVDSDRANRKLFLLADGHVSRRAAFGLYIAVTLAALLGAFLVNWQLGSLFAVGVWLGLQYSLPRFNVRANPYKAMRNNMLGHGTIAFLFGWVLVQNFNIEGILRSIPYLLAVGAVYLNTTLPDAAGDKAVGKVTYAIFWGTARTLRRAAIMVVVAFLFSIMTADYGFTLAAGISAPIFIMAALRNSVETSTLATKVSILALSVFACIHYPLYILLLAGTILATRIYYPRRFNVNYPALFGEGK